MPPSRAMLTSAISSPRQAASGSSKPQSAWRTWFTKFQAFVLRGRRPVRKELRDGLQTAWFA
jgi:hypothetical protein